LHKCALRGAKTSGNLRFSRTSLSARTAQSGPWPPNQDAAVQPVEAAIRACRSILSAVTSVCGRSVNSLRVRQCPLWVSVGTVLCRAADVRLARDHWAFHSFNRGLFIHLQQFIHAPLAHFAMGQQNGAETG